GLRLTHLVPAGQHDEAEKDQPRDCVGDAFLEGVPGGLVELETEEMHRTRRVPLDRFMACRRRSADTATEVYVQPVQCSRTRYMGLNTGIAECPEHRDADRKNEQQRKAAGQRVDLV